MALGTASGVTQLRDLTVRFDRTLKAAPDPLYKMFCTVVQSEGADESYGWLGEMPGMREWIGDRLFKELRAATYQLSNKHWEQSLLVKKTDIEDARMLKYGALVDALAIEGLYHPDELFFTLLANGATNFCFDGQYFYDTDHQFGDSGLQSNKLSAIAATGTTPTPDEFRDAYNAAYSAMIAFKGDNGKALFRPTVNTSTIKTVVTVPAQLLTVATTALTAKYDVSENPVVVNGSPELLAIPYLTDATKFQVHNVSGVLKPFVFQERKPLSRQIKNMDDLEHKDAKFMTEARYNAGYGAWWNSVETTFT